eukprot:TRINITY_DN23970_c2_g1_i1.p1 TRINITY_DN23970_c2_g1~~TRINITY_DN23970_c2_g1_i1.p1  ORF type:complete len:337 (-),score=47.12 TRINITY_DN23970_c2_g1_i1:154-1164(-)
MILSLEAVGFKTRDQFVPGDIMSLAMSGTYMHSYQRRPKIAKWLDGLSGPVTLSDFLRQWLVKNEHMDKSVCEVIQLDDRFSHIRRHVGTARVFWSHLQLESFLRGHWGEGECTAGHIANAVRSHDIGVDDPIWLDYFCLRQCKSDFVPEVVVELIGWIGKVVASMNGTLKFMVMADGRIGAWQLMGEYLKRSFCILELFAAVKGRASLSVPMNYPVNQLLPLLMSSKPTGSTYERGWIGPVSSKAAGTRDNKDKELIEGFIKDHIGFEEFDRIVSISLIDAAPRGIQMLGGNLMDRQAEQEAKEEMERRFGTSIDLTPSAIDYSKGQHQVINIFM